ncbi:phage tail tube protein, partial [Clostridioides difficile]
KVAEVKKFQAKMEFTKEDIIIAGQMGTDTKYMGYKGKGSITLSLIIQFFIAVLSASTAFGIHR